MDYKEKYEQVLERAKNKLALAKKALESGSYDKETIEYIFPELAESEDEKMLNQLHSWMKEFGGAEVYTEEVYAWLKNLIEKQGKPKEINLVEILKHYPRETELYSPLYGKLWLAEVNEEQEIITCYKHHLEEGCTRAEVEQEDTVAFYFNGTTGLPDFKISKDCMLFLYDAKKQDEQNLIMAKSPQLSEQKPSWSEEDEKIFNTLIQDIQERHPKAMWIINSGSTEAVSTKYIIDWLKSLKERIES